MFVLSLLVGGNRRYRDRFQANETIISILQYVDYEEY